jgi:kynureninase
MMTEDALISRDVAQARDATDPLARMRAHFALPEDVIYLDGNSLGPLPHAVRDRVARTIDDDWVWASSAAGTMPAGSICPRGSARASPG